MSANCLHSFLCSNDVSHLSVRDCQYLIKYFDIDRDSGLNYTEFMQMVLPCDNLHLRSDASQREPRGLSNEGRLTEQLERLLTDFLEKEIALHLRLENMKAQITTRFDWNPSDVFNAVDITHDGFLNHRNIQLYLKSQSLYASDEEIIAMVRRLDADADQKINFNEFCETFSV